MAFLQLNFNNYIGFKICEPVLLLPSGLTLLLCNQVAILRINESQECTGDGKWLAAWLGSGSGLGMGTQRPQPALQVSL